jgi:hypothetical protein
LVRGETVAVDGSKFRTVSSAASVRERNAVQHYLEQLDRADAQEEVVIDSSAVQAALERLKSDPEPEARFMRTADGLLPAYNVQTAVNAEHAIIVAQTVTDEATDNRSLLPMAEAAKTALGNPKKLNVIADQATRTANRPSSVKRKALRPTCRPIAASTIRAMANCSTAVSSTTTRRPIAIAAQPSRHWHENSCSGTRRESFMPLTRQCVALVL